MLVIIFLLPTKCLRNPDSDPAVLRLVTIYISSASHTQNMVCLWGGPSWIQSYSAVGCFSYWQRDFSLENGFRISHSWSGVNTWAYDKCHGFHIMELPEGSCLILEGVKQWNVSKYFLGKAVQRFAERLEESCLCRSWQWDIPRMQKGKTFPSSRKLWFQLRLKSCFYQKVSLTLTGFLRHPPEWEYDQIWERARKKWESLLLEVCTLSLWWSILE